MRKRLTLKPVLWSLFAGYCVYLLGGLLLTYLGILPKLYFLPGWAIKPPHHDTSTVSADGPLVFHSHNQIVIAQLHPTPQSARRSIDTSVSPLARQLTCFVEETRQSFSFRLHPLVASEPWSYAQPARLLVVSDIEGNFKGLQLLLRKAGVVDKQLTWQFGAGHLVFLGDMFDRGLQVTECLWLLYKLEEEARRAGGKVHFILGNHEQMNLTGHYRYVRRKYRHNADTLALAYSSWYGPNTELGRWLRSKNVIERIGNTLFVHGGISPQLASQRVDLPLINQVARWGLDTTHNRGATPLYELINTNGKLSPTWYRGLAQQEASAQHVKNVLTQYGATRLVIGHTPVDKITPLYQGQVIAIDLPHQERIAQGVMEALWIENDTFYRFNTQQGRRPL